MLTVLIYTLLQTTKSLESDKRSDGNNANPKTQLKFSLTTEDVSAYPVILFGRAEKSTDYNVLTKAV